MFEVDQAIFVFDNGDKSMIASMLRYAQKRNENELKRLSFCVVFFGSSLAAKDQEPFSLYPQKMISYKELGISENIDHTWPRDGVISLESLHKMAASLHVRKKIWTAVSSFAFSQIIEWYKNRLGVVGVAFRDNPSPWGHSDYFKISQEVQKKADIVLVPSGAALDAQASLKGEIKIVGHGPIEEQVSECEGFDRSLLAQRLHFSCALPIALFAGSYGQSYKDAFELFLEIAKGIPVQGILMPHPRYKGSLELSYREYIEKNLSFTFLNDRIKGSQALFISDIVMTTDATSTIVFQAKALGKKVIYINSESLQMDGASALVHPVKDRNSFLKAIQEPQAVSQDVFALMRMPRNGAYLLWKEFLEN